MKHLRILKLSRVPSRMTIMILTLLLSHINLTIGQDVSFTVTQENPSNHVFHVKMVYRDIEDAEIAFIMPTWTPGYYQKLDFAKNVLNLQAFNENNELLSIDKKDENTWSIDGFKDSTIRLEYDIIANRNFVATPYLDEKRGYIVPGGLFVYPDSKLTIPVTINIIPNGTGQKVVTGLKRVNGSDYTYMADNYDILYDSPLLIGELEELPFFTVEGIPHYFIGYKLGDFDHSTFMNDLKGIVETVVGLFGDIPYEHYTFIGIGPGRGGIEHMNSTTVSFDGNNLNTDQKNLDVLFFLAHEYFHTYNVKRIRPIELGPFDYVNGSRTNLLWVSEGLSVYYEYLILKRAGLCSEEELLNVLQGNIKAHENRPGRFVQSLAEASYQTWSDGPFGGSGDGMNKTISYYDKGPLVGMFLDLKIRHATNNTRSLDDVMRTLYAKFYLEQDRGFTEDEFRMVCEETAGIPLDDIFEYVYTTKELDYNKYLEYAGFELDRSSLTIKNLPSIGEHQKVIKSGWLNGI